MGESLNITKIIEFNGVPGIGKTTIALNLFNELQVRNIQVCYFSEYYSSLKKNKYLLLKAILKIRIIQIQFLLNSFYVMRYKNIFKQTRRIMSAFKHFLLMNYCYETQKYHCIIMDQGLIQSWISYFHSSKIQETNSFKELFKKVANHYAEYYIVNTHLEKDIIVERLCNREFGTSRLDKLHEQEKLKVVEVQIINFELIRNAISSDKAKYIDTSKTINFNVKEIIEFVVNQHQGKIDENEWNYKKYI